MRISSAGAFVISKKGEVRLARAGERNGRKKTSRFLCEKAILNYREYAIY